MKIIGKLKDTRPDDHAAFKTWSDDVKRKRGRPPQGDRPKVQVTTRLDADVVDWLKAKGPDWRARMNAILKEAREHDAA